MTSSNNLVLQQCFKPETLYDSGGRWGLDLLIGVSTRCSRNPTKADIMVYARSTDLNQPGHASSLASFRIALTRSYLSPADTDDSDQKSSKIIFIC